jgi:hypothetical protein
MPYPESCPECGGAFRNTGTHFTARRNEIGRHVLLELGCQNTTRRFWWDFTTGSLTEDGRTIPARRATPQHAVAVQNGTLRDISTNGHVALSMLDRPEPQPEPEPEPEPERPVVHGPSIPTALDGRAVLSEPPQKSEEPVAVQNDDDRNGRPGDVYQAEIEEQLSAAMGLSATTSGPAEMVEIPGPTPTVSPSMKEAFVRQLQLDRLTLRQMRSWLMSEEARRAIEVAAGATEATYERLALILFGVDLAQLLGKQTAAPASTGMSAEERLELQREKARIRARLRRAAAKAARQQ